MISKKTKRGYAVLWMAVVAITAICYFGVVNTYALVSDDFIYQNITGTTQKVQTISDIFYSQYVHYFTWGGRTVAHVIVQMLLLIEKPISSIIITLTILLLTFLICKNIFGKKKITIASWVITATSIFLFNPNPEETLFWITGTGNYLFTIVIVLAFVYPFRLLIENEVNADSRVISSIVKAVSMLALGVLAGWTNENLGAALVITLMGIILWQIKKAIVNNKSDDASQDKKWHAILPLWAYTGVAGATVGFVVLLLAPGNLKRNNAILETYGNIFKIVAYRIYMMERALFTYLWVIVIITGIFVMVKLYLKKQKLNATEIIFLIMGVLSYITMIAAPTYPDRVTFSTICLLLIVCVSILSGLIKDNKEYTITTNCISAFMLVTFVCQCATRVLLPMLK